MGNRFSGAGLKIVIIISSKDGNIMYTQCNYCYLKTIRRKAKAEGKKVTILNDTKWEVGGFNIYVHPSNVNIRELIGGEDGERKEYRSAWVWEIGKRCSC